METDLESKSQQIRGSDLSPACWGGACPKATQSTPEQERGPAARFTFHGAYVKGLVLAFCWVRGHITVSYKKKFQLVRLFVLGAW